MTSVPPTCRDTRRGTKCPRKAPIVFLPAWVNYSDDAFTFARLLGIATTIGTETPLTVPKVVQERLRSRGRDPQARETIRELYRGIFRRDHAKPSFRFLLVLDTGGLDLVWLYRRPGARNSPGPPTCLGSSQAGSGPLCLGYLRLGTWSLPGSGTFRPGPPQEMPLSCINRQVGFARWNRPSRVSRPGPSGPSPGLEDDPALISPQLWVGRMRKDAADAYRYGLYRTDGNSLADLAIGAECCWLWQLPLGISCGWNPDWDKPVAPLEALPEGPEGGRIATFAQGKSPTPTRTQFTAVSVMGWRAGDFGYPTGVMLFALKFCEPHHTQANKRVFGVAVQGRIVAPRVDLFALVGKNRAYDIKVDQVVVTDGVLEIRFLPMADSPCIAGIVLEGPVVRKINCGGPAWNDYAADQDPPPAPARFLDSEDFYRDWATAQFGPEAARRDCCHLCSAGRTVTSTKRLGARSGGIRPDTRPWAEVSRVSLRRRVGGLGIPNRGTGQPGTLRALACFVPLYAGQRQGKLPACRYQAEVAALEKLEDPESCQKHAHERVFPSRSALVLALEELHQRTFCPREYVRLPRECGQLATTRDTHRA